MQKKTISFILSAFLSHGVFAQVNEAPFLDIPVSEDVEILPYLIPENNKLNEIKENTSKSSDPKVIVFEVRNQGAFAAHATVDYRDARGVQQHVRSPTLYSNDVHRFVIPRLSTHINANAYSHTGIIWDKIRKAYSQTLTEETQGMSTFGEGRYLGIGLTGTTLSPRWHHNDVSKGVGHGLKLDPYALHPQSCTEAISYINTGEVMLNNHCDYSVVFNSSINTTPYSTSEEIYIPQKSSRKSAHSSNLFNGFYASIPSAPLVQMTEAGFAAEFGFYVARNQETGALNLYRPKDLQYINPPSGKPESDENWRFLGPRSEGQEGVKGDMYSYTNPHNNNVELFTLMDNYSDAFPTDQRSSPSWSFQPPREWRNYDPDAVQGQIYVHENTLNHQTELFELKRVPVNKTYSYFPTDKSDNDDWHYLGHIE